MKKFLNFFNIFELNLNSKSYKSPVIRIIVSLLIIAAICVFRLNVTISNALLNIFLAIIILAVMIMSVLCLFVALVECLQVGDNRKNDKTK